MTGHTPLSAEERKKLFETASAAYQGRWWWGGNVGDHHGDIGLRAIVPGSGWGVMNVLDVVQVERTKADADKRFSDIDDYLDAGLSKSDVKDLKRTWLRNEYGDANTDGRLAFLSGDGFHLEVARDHAVFEVGRNQNLPDDTPADDPRIYRHDVVDVRNPNARHITAANPATVLRLLADLEAAEARLKELEQS